MGWTRLTLLDMARTHGMATIILYITMHNIQNIARQCLQCWSMYVWYDLIGSGFLHSLPSAWRCVSFCHSPVISLFWYDGPVVRYQMFDEGEVWKFGSQSTVVESWDAPQLQNTEPEFLSNLFLGHIHSHYILLYPSVSHGAERFFPAFPETWPLRWVVPVPAATCIRPVFTRAWRRRDLRVEITFITETFRNDWKCILPSL